MPNKKLYIKVNDIKHELPFNAKQERLLKKNNIHYGQLKLLVNEISVIIQFYKKFKEHPKVVYAGAAPGHHHFLLYKLFPSIKCVFIDPEMFDIYVSTYTTKLESYFTYIAKPNKQINYKPDYYKIRMKISPVNTWSNIIKTSPFSMYIINDLFDNEMAKEFSKLENILFISDIRTTMNITNATHFQTYNNEPTDLDILWNSSQQLNWVKIIKPKMFSLKFRFPYYDDKSIRLVKKFHSMLSKGFIKIMKEDFKLSEENGINFIEDYFNKQFRFIEGDFYIQSYAPPSSSETRLNGINIKKYTTYSYVDILTYQNKMFYFNMNNRQLNKRSDNDKELFEHTLNSYVKLKLEYRNGAISTISKAKYFINPILRLE